MWWVNKFGSISGPYSDEQIEKGIRQRVFTKWNKISSDKQIWNHLGQTEFWNPISSRPDPQPLPPEFARGKIGSVAHGRDAVEPKLQPVTAVEPTPPPKRNKFDPLLFVVEHRIGVAIAGGVCAVGIVTLACVMMLGSDKNGQVQPPPPDTNIVVNPPSVEPSKDLSKAPDPFKAVLLVHTKEGGSGTAFLVKMDGKTYAVSNDHVVRSKFAPEMVFVDGCKLTLGAMSIARDRDLVRFEVKDDRPAFEIASGLPHDNDEIWVYGNAKGDDVIVPLRGFVNGVGSKIIRINANFVRGNSGSPILNARHEVVGVAAFFKNGDNGRDWTSRNTAFDEVRRFGIRFTNVEWVKVNHRIYQEQCTKLERIGIYWEYLLPYLICQDVPEERYRKLKLEHKDIDKKSFGEDSDGFHEMLMDVSKSYAGQGGSLRKWQNLLRDRDALIKELNEAIKSGNQTQENGEKALKEFDEKKNIAATWENVKSKHRDFYAKRKEALLMAKGVLSGIDWQDPLMRHGYGDDQKDECVDWYLDGIQYFLDQNSQKLKDLNKKLKEIEKGDECDEE